VAAGVDPTRPYPADLFERGDAADRRHPSSRRGRSRPTYRAGAVPSAVARRFNSAVVDLIARVCKRLRERTGLDAVALSGGCS